MDGLAKNRIFLKEGKRDIGAEGLFVSLFGMYRKRLAHRICGRRRGGGGPASFANNISRRELK